MEYRGRWVDESMQLLQQEARPRTQVEEPRYRAPAIQDRFASATQRHASGALDRADPFLFPVFLGVVADQRSSGVEHVDHLGGDVDRAATGTGEVRMTIDRRIPRAATGQADRAIDTRHRMFPCMPNSVPDLSLENRNAGTHRRAFSSAGARSSSAPCRSSTT